MVTLHVKAWMDEALWFFGGHNIKVPTKALSFIYLQFAGHAMPATCSCYCSSFYYFFSPTKTNRH